MTDYTKHNREGTASFARAYSRMKNAPPKAHSVPCGSCPYRRDVPSGIWEQEEYDKLLDYDGETWEQSIKAFWCHQYDGTLCSGWLACHIPNQLLALRLPGTCDPSVFDYKTDVPVFASGAEAREHGMRDINNPGPAALKMVAGLMKQRNYRNR